ncbi:MAG: alpha/beta hydrolase domain-containing protein [Acidimicrobiales bacterium]
MASRRAGALLVAALVLVAAASCTSHESSDEEGDDVTPATVDRPAGAAAKLGGPLTGGHGINLVTAGGGPSLAEVGYTEAEYTASGTATSYATTQDPSPTDGHLELEPNGEAEYTTRVVVRRPADPAAFNGTVVLEWLNVSAGADSAPGYTYLADELVRGGYAWVGVSAQQVGIEGGVVAAAPDVEGAGLGRGLKANDPERYGSLDHPGDAFSYDMYTQVARALRAPDSPDPLDGLDVRWVVAMGQSQSAAALTTYVNGVQPLTEAFDGFLIHSRFGGAAPLGEPGEAFEIVSMIRSDPVPLRTDGRAPVLVVETETDVVGFLLYLPARQPDDERLRLWEIAGTAHADKTQAGAGEALFGCPLPINRGQQRFVLRAALRHLVGWVEGRSSPPEADRLEVDDSGAAPRLVVDDVGNARGGVRTPAVDAPVDVLSGTAQPGAPIVCLLSGSTVPLDEAQLAARYESPDDYLAQYEAATDDMIERGFALRDDRDQLLADADPGRLAG